MARRPWVVLDGDDTLWRTTEMYDRARIMAVAMIAARGHDAGEVDAWMRAHDVARTADMGYSMHRFAGTLRETAIHFLGEGEHAWAASGMGYSVFADTARPVDGVEAFLERLRERFPIAVFTAGDITVQQKRVRDFAWSSWFSAVRIVLRKDAAAFATLAGELDIDPASSWVVGDSLRSDINPAVQAGFRAIHFDTYNWAAYERDGHGLPPGCTSVPTLGIAADHILSAGPCTPPR